VAGAVVTTEVSGIGNRHTDVCNVRVSRCIVCVEGITGVWVNSVHVCLSNYEKSVFGELVVGDFEVERGGALPDAP